MIANCTKCKKEIEYRRDIHYIDGKPHCKDCYFGELGAMMEKYPPGFPTSHNPYNKH